MNFVTIALIYVFISLILCEVTARDAYGASFFNWINERVEAEYNSYGKALSLWKESNNFYYKIYKGELK